MSENNGNDMLSQLLKEIADPAVVIPTVTPTDETAPVLDTNDEILDLGEDFDFDGFQVVRREFFAHLHEPSVTFNKCKFGVNMA